MSDSRTDKRTRSRISVNIPATVRSKEMALESSAMTRDLSMGGVFLYTDRQITEGSKLEIVLILPAELGLGEKQWACCQASVVRVEDGGGKQFGVAATIDRLDMLPEIPT
jgi:PilZ domain-containing protein